MKKLNKLKITFLSLLIFGCSQESPKKVLNPAVTQKVYDLTESFNPQLDILFVVDDSASMGQHQANFSSNVDLFIQSFVKQNLNYHLGVISSSEAEHGSLLGSPKVIDNLTPDGAAKFSANIRVGTDGDGYEKFFSPIVEALSPYNLNGPNKDFLRKDSFLVIVFITDAEDQSRSEDAVSTLAFLEKLKGNKSLILSYGVIIPTVSTTSCTRDDYDMSPKRIETFLGLTQNTPNNVLDLCDNSFGTKLAQFSKDIANIVGSTIFLKRLPVVSSIVVSYGDQIIPPGLKKGWSYDLERNAIILGSEIDFTSQPVGTKVNIGYTPIEE